ncbi:glycosyltransferase family 9 protein [Paraferrimonas sp. SM1919]|uniref:glycosyltransferase family 9 protein n=1 Tax=Paraferrimonas sp. SM1919 TaxID=2662263 RepID=UPI0013D444DF|nr:glycosyltransferase family 9 protein [Paraferrimonas sp. SM1919]
MKESICLFRLSAIGDICHAAAMIKALKANKPNASITWIIGKIEYQLVRHIEGVEFIIFDKSRGNKAYFDLWRTLKGRKFDALLLMQVALRANIASLGIRAKRRIGFNKELAKEGHSLVINETIDNPIKPHVLDGFLAFVRRLCHNPNIQFDGWDLPIPEDNLLQAKQLLNSEKPALVICPAASKAERNWLPERYAQVCDHASANGYQVYICGAPTELEKQLATDIISHCQQKPVNLVGKTPLLTLMAVLKQAKAVIAPDTGPLHMAVTQGTKAIGLYAHSNPDRTGPYLNRELTVSVYQQCIEQQTGQPLADIPWGKRAKGEQLMELISCEQVINSMAKITN